jgi:glycyl-tRNA synthetase beta chain
MKREDLLIELLSEELPPKTLLIMAEAFKKHLETGLNKAALTFKDIKYFASPRRLALIVSQLAKKQQDQILERKGPAKSVAFDAKGEPTPACLGFMRASGAALEDLITVNNTQGAWIFVKQKVAGKPVAELLPAIINDALTALPIAKRMRWGDSAVQFVRPVHRLVLLYGKDVIPAAILGCNSDRLTEGHRFHMPKTITIEHAADYPKLLEEGMVIADFFVRRQIIRTKVEEQVKEIANTNPLIFDENLQEELRNPQEFTPEKYSELVNVLRKNTAKKTKNINASALMPEDLLDEVTGLVEWPHALLGQFDAAFLSLPKEVLISAMQDHQRYFPILDAKGELLPYFITISNIESSSPQQVIQGNERVLRARLSDAAFFYQADQKEQSSTRLLRLKGISAQAKLGTLYDKAERLSHLATWIAEQWQINTADAARAALLAKTDLTSNMVGEFPELQGVMGEYYALQEGESEAVAQAIREHYLPRFAADHLPKSLMGSALAIADRLDTLTAAFGMKQIPTGDKDPYGLRRAALAVLRILIENRLELDLKQALQVAQHSYHLPLDNTETETQLLHFIQERLPAFYQEQEIKADVFAAVQALGISNPLDFDQRVKAVQAFKKLDAALALAEVNKRVSNILAQYTKNIAASSINPAYLVHPAEQQLAQRMALMQAKIQHLAQHRSYEDILILLADLHQPVDEFFAEVLVMAEDQATRENRLLVLQQLRALFLQVADIALLQ